MHFAGTGGGEGKETANHTNTLSGKSVVCLPEEKRSSETKTAATREKNVVLRGKGDNAADAPLSLLTL